MDGTEITVVYRVYRVRWVQLFVYFLATFANTLPSVTFVPIEAETATFFKITSTEVNTLAIVFLFLYVPGTVLSIWAYQRFSMRSGMIIGSLLNLGVWIRLFALIWPSRSYPILMLGQFFPAITAPLFLNLIALFAARWFAPQQRDIATAIGSMAMPLGGAIGALLPSLIVTDGVSSHSFFILLTIEAAFTTLTTLLVIVIFRSEPPSPPSPSEEHHQSINVKQDLGRLFTNSHYLILLFGFSFGFAAFLSITTLAYQLIQPSGYSSENAGVFGATLITVGLISSFAVGIIMGRTHTYRLLLKVLVVGACASVFYFIVILRPNMLYPLGVSIALLGFFLMPILPISFECAVECTYPVRAEWSTGLLLCVGNVLGGGFTFLLGYLIKLALVYKPGVIFTPASIFIICIFVIGGLALIMYKGPYLRLEAERMAVAKCTVNTSGTIR